jgi:tRNA (guanine26-N2/guanine27-N2)-dimethyltransferase
MELWMETLKYHEGRTILLAPKPAHAPSKAIAFYNPRMAFNRDISVLTLKAHIKIVSGEGLRICDAMTGVGARGIRYAREVEEVSEVVLNDLNPIALQFAEYNSHLNKVNEKTRIVHDEANRALSLASTPDSRFDLVDLDPFGTPVPYIDSGVRALKIEGIFAATATDLPVLQGIHPRAADRRYGASIYPTDYGHELAIRVLIQKIIRVAAAHELASYPIFCYYADHYVRVNLTLKRGKENINSLLDQIGYVEHCHECGYRKSLLHLNEFSKLCPICRRELKLIGPVWLGPLFDETYCRNMLGLVATVPLREENRIRKFLSLTLEEVNSPALFYSLSSICDRLNIPQKGLLGVVDDLRKLGYRASRTHIKGDAVKTDAPINVVEEVLKP